MGVVGAQLPDQRFDDVSADVHYALRETYALHPGEVAARRIAAGSDAEGIDQLGQFAPQVFSVMQCGPAAAPWCLTARRIPQMLTPNPGKLLLHPRGRVLNLRRLAIRFC